MGIYFRYATALIILATFSDSYAAVRKNVNLPDVRTIVDNSDRPFQTPNGSSGFFGQDYVDEHTAGNRFKPGDSPGSTPPKQKVTVKPKITINPRAAAKAMAGAMRGGIPGAVVSAAASAMVGAVGAVMDGAGAIKMPSIQEVPPEKPSDYGWYVSGPKQSSPLKACQLAFPQLDDVQALPRTESTRTCHSPLAGGSLGTAYLDGSTCPAETFFDPDSGTCRGSFLVDPSESDWQSMEDFAAAQNSDFVKDIVKRSCEGSSSPQRCYEDLVKRGDMEGPSSQTDTPQTSTTTKTNPDGTTSTTSTTTQNRYDYKYGDNYYNYSTTTKVTTTTDGQTTTEETTNGLPTDGDEPSGEESDESYVFSDSQMPEVPSFYDQQYPDGLAGAWDNASVQVNNSQFIQFLNGFVPSFSGSCPSFGLSFNIASWASYGSIGFSSLCYVFDFIKVILLVTALFTFRAITFGG